MAICSEPWLKALNRRVQNPYPRPILPFLPKIHLLAHMRWKVTWDDLPSSFSSFFSSSAGASAGAPPAAPPLGAAAAPPPDPTFNSRSLTFFPSSAYELCQGRLRYWRSKRARHALANSVVHILSTSGTLAALMMVWSLSACCLSAWCALTPNPWGLTVGSRFSSARISAAYDTASSDWDMVIIILVYNELWTWLKERCDYQGSIEISVVSFRL